MYLYVSHDSSNNIYGSNFNTLTDFVYELPYELSLPGKWTVSVTDFFVDIDIPDNIYIYCDIVQPSSVFGESKTLLKIIRDIDKTIIPEPHVLSCEKLKRINFYIRDKNNRRPELKGTNLILVLELREL